jgi:hypothetical protein
VSCRKATCVVYPHTGQPQPGELVVNVPTADSEVLERCLSHCDTHKPVSLAATDSEPKPAQPYLGRVSSLEEAGI